MKIHLRFDEVNTAHSRFTIFVNGHNCGQLCMSPAEADWFYFVLDRGCKALNLPGEQPPKFEFVGSGKSGLDGSPIPPVPMQ